MENLHHAWVMSKRDKVLAILGVIVLGAVCFGLLQQPNEPKYNGRHLSEWLAMYRRSDEHADEANRAIRAIGTNALPCYTKWIRYGPTKSRISLYNKLPSWMKTSPMVQRWHSGPFLRAAFAVDGIMILGTNAASAIPELTMIMRDGTKPWASRNAIKALGGVGEPAIPVLKAALADTNQVNRWRIVHAFADMAGNGHTNAWPSLLQLAPHLLTNAPAK